MITKQGDYVVQTLIGEYLVLAVSSYDYKGNQGIKIGYLSTDKQETERFLGFGYVTTIADIELLELFNFDNLPAFYKLHFNHRPLSMSDNEPKLRIVFAEFVAKVNFSLAPQI